MEDFAFGWTDTRRIVPGEEMPLPTTCLLLIVYCWLFTDCLLTITWLSIMTVFCLSPYITWLSTTENLLNITWLSTIACLLLIVYWLSPDYLVDSIYWLSTTESLVNITSLTIYLRQPDYLVGISVFPRICLGFSVIFCILPAVFLQNKYFRATYGRLGLKGLWSSQQVDNFALFTKPQSGSFCSLER